MKPSALALSDMAVLGNQQALCPVSQLLAEYEDVFSIDDARAKCSKHSCSHFTWDVVGARSTKGGATKLQLWCGLIDGCGLRFLLFVAVAEFQRRCQKKVCVTNLESAWIMFAAARTAPCIQDHF